MITDKVYEKMSNIMNNLIVLPNKKMAPQNICLYKNGFIGTRQ